MFLAFTCLLVLLVANIGVSGFVVTERQGQVCKKLNGVVVDSIDVSDGEAGPPKRFMYMTKEQDEELKAKGDNEAALMSNNLSPLKANKVKGVGGSGGFGGGKPNFKAQAKAHAKVLRKDGIVRIDNILPGTLADDLKEYLVDLRARGKADIESGIIIDSQERFADVLLNQNRCDLKIPLGPKVVNDAMHHILSKTCIRTLIESVYDSYGGEGSQAEIYELNSFMSNSGARRQLVHADNSCDTVGLPEAEPVMLTCFIALQDVDKTMGPTTWIPGTHNVKSHDQFYEVVANDDGSGESSKDKLLRTRKKAEGTLPKGSCAVFDPRTLHCAGANVCADPNLTRALFYFSFKNPRVEYPGCPSTGGYGIADAKLTLKELCDELAIAAKAKSTDGSTGSERLDQVACYP